MKREVLPTFIERGFLHEEVDDTPDRFHPGRAPWIGQTIALDVVFLSRPSGRGTKTLTLRGRVVDVVDARHVEVRLYGRAKSLPRRLQAIWCARLERKNDRVPPWMLCSMERAESKQKVRGR